MFDRNRLEGLSDSPESPPATEVSVLFVGGFRFCFYVGFHPAEGLILCSLFLIQGLYQEWWPSPLGHFSVYIVKFSKSVRQGVRGKSKFIIVIMKL